MELRKKRWRILDTLFQTVCRSVSFLYLSLLLLAFSLTVSLSLSLSLTLSQWCSARWGCTTLRSTRNWLRRWKRFALLFEDKVCASPGTVETASELDLASASKLFININTNFWNYKLIIIELCCLHANKYRPQHTPVKALFMHHVSSS